MIMDLVMTMLSSIDILLICHCNLRYVRIQGVLGLPGPPGQPGDVGEEVLYILRLSTTAKLILFAFFFVLWHL